MNRNRKCTAVKKFYTGQKELLLVGPVAICLDVFAGGGGYHVRSYAPPSAGTKLKLKKIQLINNIQLYCRTMCNKILSSALSNPHTPSISVLKRSYLRNVYSVYDKNPN